MSRRINFGSQQEGRLESGHEFWAIKNRHMRRFFTGYDLVELKLLNRAQSPNHLSRTRGEGVALLDSISEAIETKETLHK